MEMAQGKAGGDGRAGRGGGAKANHRERTGRASQSPRQEGEMHQGDSASKADQRDPFNSTESEVNSIQTLHIPSMTQRCRLEQAMETRGARVTLCGETEEFQLFRAHFVVLSCSVAGLHIP